MGEGPPLPSASAEASTVAPISAQLASPINPPGPFTTSWFSPGCAPLQRPFTVFVHLGNSDFSDPYHLSGHSAYIVHCLAYNRAQQTTGEGKTVDPPSSFILTHFPRSPLCSRHSAQGLAQRNRGLVTPIPKLYSAGGTPSALLWLLFFDDFRYALLRA